MLQHFKDQPKELGSFLSLLPEAMCALKSWTISSPKLDSQLVATCLLILNQDSQVITQEILLQALGSPGPDQEFIQSIVCSFEIQNLIGCVALWALGHCCSPPSADRGKGPRWRLQARLAFASHTDGCLFLSMSTPSGAPSNRHELLGGNPCCNRMQYEQ